MVYSSVMFCLSKFINVCFSHAELAVGFSFSFPLAVRMFITKGVCSKCIVLWSLLKSGLK
jgi:hypothetical protein